MGVDAFRTLSANLIVQHLTRPRALVIQAWFWLAAETEDIEEKKRCLWAILDLDPDNTDALLALTVLRTQEPQD